MLQTTLRLASIVLLALMAMPAQGLAQEDHPFQIAFIGPTMQLVDDDANIKGIRLNLPYGVNENLWGLDVGFVNHVRGSASAWQHGLVNLTEESFKGWQDGFVNLSPGDFVGLQTGAVNHAGYGQGVQLAPLVNHTRYMEGFQMSLVNFAEDMHGVQVGLINIIRSKDRLPILPIINWKMD